MKKNGAGYKVALVQIARLGDLTQVWPLVCDLHREHGIGRLALVVDNDLRSVAEMMVPQEAVIDIPISSLLRTASTEDFIGIWHAISGLSSELSCTRAERIINLNYHPPAAVIAMAIDGQEHLGAKWHDVIRNQPSDEIIDRLFKVNTGLRHGDRHLSDLWRGYAKQQSGLSWKPLDLSDHIKSESAFLLGEQGIDTGSRPVAIVVGASHKRRRWGTENVTALIEAIKDTVPVVLLGTRSETGLADEILNSVQNEPLSNNIVSLCGLTTIPVLAGVLQKCKLVIGVDTGALHLAAAVGTPCLGIYFGSMNFRETGPYGDGHVVITPDDMDYPCHEREMETNSAGFGGYVPHQAVARFLTGGNGSDSDAYCRVNIFRSVLTESGLSWENEDMELSNLRRRESGERNNLTDSSLRWNDTLKSEQRTGS